MCDLLAPLLVILDDGKVYSVLHVLFQSYYLTLFCDRGDGLLLFLATYEANELELSTRRRHGPTLCKHAISYSGDSHITLRTERFRLSALNSLLTI